MSNRSCSSINLCVKKFWLVKQEPSAYSWANFVTDGKTSWTGVRNYTARNNLRFVDLLTTMLVSTGAKRVSRRASGLGGGSTARR